MIRKKGPEHMEERKGNPEGRKIIISILLCAAILALVFSGAAEHFSDRHLRNSLNERNNSYLLKTEQKALSGFLLLSGIKAGLSIIEGSTANLALADIQFGDIVQSILDAVDITWKILFATLGILMSLRLLLLLADQSAWYFLLFGASAFMLSLLLRCLLLKLRFFRTLVAGLAKASRRTGLLLVMAFLFLYILVPFSIYGSSLLSASITESASVEALGYIENFNTDISEVIETGSPEEQASPGTDESVGFLKKITEAPARVLNYPRELLFKIKNTIVGQTKNLTLKMISLLVCFLFDVLFFPLILLFLSYLFLKTTLSGLLIRWNQTDILEDFQRFSAWYNQKDRK